MLLYVKIYLYLKGVLKEQNKLGDNYYGTY